MTEEITARTIFDVPSMMEAFRWHYRKANIRSYIIGSIALVMFGLALYSWSDSAGETAFPPALVIAPLPAILLVALSRWVSRFAFAKSIRSSPSVGKDITYTMDDTGIVINLESARAEFAWNFFLKSLSTPAGVLLYTQKQAFNWLPKTAFASEADYERFLKLIGEKTKHSKIG